MEQIQARLRRLERRDWWLWSTAITLMVLLTLAVVSLTVSTFSHEDHPVFHSRLQQAALGLLGLVLLFSAYTIYQLTVIKRLRRELAEQIATGFRLQSRANELERLAMLDPLTGLYNRQFLEQHLAGELARSQRHGYALNVLSLDVDNVKEINQHLGENAGDLVLKEFADRLTKTIRSSDLAVRMGGDEFLVLLPESSPERMPHLLARLSGLEVDFGEQKIPVTFSAGWATYEPGQQPNQVLERAHQELIADKATGRTKDAIQRAQAELRQLQNVDALKRLAGKVAHDFNGLLSLVKGYSELALDLLGQDDPLRDYIEHIHQANERANSLTRQLVAFTRTQVAGPQVLDLNTVVADMEKVLRRLMGERIELVTRPGDMLGEIKGDRGQIEQVVLNLVVNACDNMPQGGRLTLETANAELDEAYAQWHPGARPGSYVMLAATDTGVGLDAEMLTHIFEPFFLTKEKGKGLGLAAVYGIIKQSGGYIWADSKPNEGTTFTVYLPRLAQKALVATASSA